LNQYLVERDPKKRKVKPVESLLTFTADLDDSDDDSDYMPTGQPDDDDDIDIDDESSDGEEDRNEDEDDDDDSGDKNHNIFKVSKSKSKKFSPHSTLDLVTTSGHRTPPRSTCSTRILVCSVCLGDISRSDDEIVECDSCGISVHEGCYGIVSDDNESVHSNTSSASTEPWFCDPCKANVKNPVSLQLILNLAYYSSMSESLSIDFN